MQVVILCGGKGTRAYPYTEHLPKPMMPIGGQPILLQVMQIYAAQGHTEFILSVGYRKEVIIDYFHGKVLDWDVEIVDTGPDTDTGGRISECRHLLRDQFMATYADGLSDIRLADLLEFHNGHEGLATITSVPLTCQYGTLELDHDGRIKAFREKPVLYEHWINAGFFVLDKEALDHWRGTNLEKHVFPALVEEGLLFAHRHDGFFKSVDTYKDHQEIEGMCRAGRMPWREGTSAPQVNVSPDAGIDRE